MTRAWRLVGVFALLLSATILHPASPASAANVRPGCDTIPFPGNDDGSVGPVAIGFPINFYGTTYTTLFVNNNGNVTFTAPLGTFTPFAITGGSIPMIAPYFADVDTRVGAIVGYGPCVVDGKPAFGVTWEQAGVGVGYYFEHTDKTNKFQLILVDMSSVTSNPGDFMIEFNYDQIQWETGDASGGSGGLGGVCAHAGFTNGLGATATFFEMPGSGHCGAFLDDNPGPQTCAPGDEDLVCQSVNTDIDGRDQFLALNGDVQTETPELDSVLLFGVGGLALLGYYVRSRRRGAKPTA